MTLQVHYLIMYRLSQYMFQVAAVFWH